MDLHDLHHNTRDGLHIASLAGAWIALVAGFGGMRDHDGAAVVRAPAAQPDQPAGVLAAVARAAAAGGRAGRTRRPTRCATAARTAWWSCATTAECCG